MDESRVKLDPRPILSLLGVLPRLKTSFSQLRSSGVGYSESKLFRTGPSLRRISARGWTREEAGQRKTPKPFSITSRVACDFTLAGVAKRPKRFRGGLYEDIPSGEEREANAASRRRRRVDYQG